MTHLKENISYRTTDGEDSNPEPAQIKGKFHTCLENCIPRTSYSEYLKCIHSLRYAAGTPTRTC